MNGSSLVTIGTSRLEVGAVLSELAYSVGLASRGVGRSDGTGIGDDAFRSAIEIVDDRVDRDFSPIQSTYARQLASRFELLTELNTLDTHIPEPAERDTGRSVTTSR
jgi:hypothetical protein